MRFLIAAVMILVLAAMAQRMAAQSGTIPPATPTGCWIIIQDRYGNICTPTPTSEPGTIPPATPETPTATVEATETPTSTPTSTATVTATETPAENDSIMLLPLVFAS